jgi:plasmid stabilization system protein ParE
VIEFIFMLTHSDRTVANARAVYDEIRDCNLRYVGFKDIGLPIPELRALSEAIRADGREVMLEVVSEAKEDELRSIRAALEIGVDWLLGGTHPEEALRILDGADGIRYCPFPGRVIGHPSLLRGTIDEIASDADRLTSLPGVHGLDLLAYRYDGDVEALAAAVKERAHGPVIAAGSVDSLERIAALNRIGVWGFTIGGAIFDGKFAGAPSVAAQIDAVLEAAAG